MNRRDIENLALEFTENSPLNIIPAEKALEPHIAGMRIFDPPIFGCASAADPLFKTFKTTPSALLPGLRLPGEWLADAAAVLSFFLPFTEDIRRENARDMTTASPAWQNARIEGQEFINALSALLCEGIKTAGFGAIAPSIDPAFAARPIPPEENGGELGFTSNWSERHAAFAAGLGTFSITRGMITRKGMAGRFGSVITSLEILPDARDYEGVYDYCIKCGACARNCLAGAISVDSIKKHAPCRAFMDASKNPRPPYYGCGKCQVGVPCESGIPARALSR